MEVPKLPSGDVLTAINNDQVLIKKWTVRKDNRAQISVCVAEIAGSSWRGTKAEGTYV